MNEEIAELRRFVSTAKGTMLIVPVQGTRNRTWLDKILNILPHFSKRVEGDDLPLDAAGKLRLPAERTVYDCLEQFKGQIYDVGELSVALDSLVDNPEEGKHSLSLTNISTLNCLQIS